MLQLASPPPIVLPLPEFRKLAGTGLAATTAAVMLFATLLLFQPLVLGRSIPQMDLQIHMRWFLQFYTALQDGQLLPRWAFASHGGLGDPTFLFYQPLLYYTASIFAWLGFSLGKALLMGIWTALVLFGMTVALALPAAWNARQRLAAIAFLMACPPIFFLSTHYGALPWAFSIPFSVLFALESAQCRPRTGRLVLWLWLIVMSHLLSAFIILMCTGLARLATMPQLRRHLPSHFNWALAVALGLALSAFFLLPAMTQWHLINPQAWTDDPTLDWRRSFAFPLLTWHAYGLRWFAVQWPLPLLALAMCAWVFVLTRGRAGLGLSLRLRVFSRRVALTALAGLLLSSELSYPLYAVTGLLQKVQWPYRFAVVSLVLASVAFSMVAFQAQAWQRTGKALRALLAATMLAYIGCAAAFQANILRAGEALPQPEQVMRGDFGQPEYLLANRGPDWQQYLDDGKFYGECERLAIRCSRVRQSSHRFQAQVKLHDPTTVRLPLFAFPAWQLKVNGHAQALRPDRETGLIAVALPAGDNQLDISWAGLPVERTGRMVSQLALAALLALLFLRR